MAKGKDSGKDSGKARNGAGAPVSNDPRFSGVHNDPRFNLPRTKHVKGKLDARFKDAISTEEGFQDRTTVDRYGRKVKREIIKKELEKYYDLEDSEEEAVKKSVDVEKDSEDSESESDEATGIIDRARGEGVSSSESESDSDDDSEDELDDEIEDTIKEEVALGDETSSFAVVNMDWDNLRAVDLMATFSSFVPPRSRILSVAIYPSEYGKKKMAQEELEGPARELFTDEKSKKKSKKGKGDEEDSDEEITEKSILQADDGEEVDSSRLRKYQLQRLKYYYAVVHCDSAATAKNIYDNCDGTEYESTANFFDLRYIPEGMEFEDDPKEECTSIPKEYKPNAFVTDALQHSKVKLTWDETPGDRLQMASKAFSQKEIDDMDFKAYLASDSEDEDAQEDSKERYRALLGPLADKLNGKKTDEDDEVDMEITFTPGLENGGDEKTEEDETTIEKYRRKEKERRKKRMEKFKSSKGDDEEEEELPAKKSGKAKKPKAQLDSKKAAELELLMMDDDITVSKKADTAKEDVKGKKSKKSKKIQAAEEAEAGFDMQDDRFRALFDNPEFAIDPTAPQFKKTKAMGDVISERRRRTLQESKEGHVKETKTKKRKLDTGSDVSSLVEKVKSRAGK